MYLSPEAQETGLQNTGRVKAKVPTQGKMGQV